MPHLAESARAGEDPAGFHGVMGGERRKTLNHPEVIERF